MNSNIHSDADAVMKTGDMGFRYAAEIDGTDHLWNRLGSCTGQRDPFCCLPAWQLAFNESRDPKSRILIRQSQDSLIAFSQKSFHPNVQQPSDYYLKSIEHSWCFGSNVLGPNGAELLYDTLIDLEPFYWRRFPPIMVSGIAPQGATYRALKKYFSKGFTFHRYMSGTQCGASLDGGVDGYYSRRSSNHRKKTRRQMRRAHEAGVEFERHTPRTEVEADAIYSRMLAVELASWKGIDECGMAEPISRVFYDAMLKRLVRAGDARIIMAMHDGRDIGFIFGSMAGKIYRGQQFSFDDNWAHASIGNVLQAEQIRWLCEEGAVRYDMGPRFGPAMEYKKHWTERLYHIQTWFLVRN